MWKARPSDVLLLMNLVVACRFKEKMERDMNNVREDCEHQLRLLQDQRRFDSQEMARKDRLIEDLNAVRFTMCFP